MSYFVFYCYVFIGRQLGNQLPRLEKREINFLLSFTCNYGVSIRRGFLFLLVLGMGFVILLWCSLGFLCNFLTEHILSVCNQ